VLTVSSR